MENRLLEILNMVTECGNFQMLECNTDKDYIRFLINCSPQYYIPNIIQKSHIITTACERIWRNIKKEIIGVVTYGLCPTL